MTTTPQPHVHADKIIQLANDITQGVWVRDQNGTNKWHCVKSPDGGHHIPAFYAECEYHVGHEPPQEPERMKLVFEGNAPWRVEPPNGKG